jgi:hypothetical protein
MIAQSLAGLVVFAGIAWLISENRKKVNFKIIITGITIQFAVGLILLKLPVFRNFFISLNRLVLSLEQSTTAGTSMVFGYLGNPFRYRLHPGHLHDRSGCRNSYPLTQNRIAMYRIFDNQLKIQVYYENPFILAELTWLFAFSVYRRPWFIPDQLNSGLFVVESKRAVRIR